MSESNELTFGLSLDENPESLDLGATETLANNEEQKIKGLSEEECNDPNQIRVTIADPDAPLIILFGPPSCGKTMALARLARYLNKRGYKISPIRSFRPSADKHYEEICKPENFNKLINSDEAAHSTSNISFMLVAVVKNGRTLCQILESPGENLFDPKKPTKPFPTYVNNIIHSNNRKLWTIMLDAEWTEKVNWVNYVERIRELSIQMDTKDKVLFIYNKIDKTDFVRGKGDVNIPEARRDVSNKYLGIFEIFRNQNPITKLFRDYNCGFIPFQTGTYTPTAKQDSKGNTVWNYQEGADYYPQMLWNEIKKSITG